MSDLNRQHNQYGEHHMANTNIGAELMNQIRENKLLENRSIFISEGVGSHTANRVVSDLLILDSISNAPIYIYINSPGGEVNSGFAIYDTIRFINSPVWIINAGLCASIATIINVAVEQKRRVSLPNSKFLIHQPLISGHVQGPASDIEITANQIMKTREKINHILAKACNQEFKKIEEDTQRDYWMSANEALDYGLISRIVEKKTDLSS